MNTKYIIKNATKDAETNMRQVILKPTHSPQKKIKHFNFLSRIENAISNKITTYNNYIEWSFNILSVGEYSYYYLESINSKINLNIVKRHDDSSIYVFLKYDDSCNEIAENILNTYLNNYWDIENF